MSKKFRDMVLAEKYLIEAEQEIKAHKLSRGEANVLGTYFDELGRLLFKYYEADDDILKKKYLEKFINTYEDTKKRVDAFLASAK